MTSWSQSLFRSCSFAENSATAGYSGVVFDLRSRGALINCTLVNNHSGSEDGKCVSVETGAEAKIYNSIMWGNGNGSLTNATGGADLYVPTKFDLDPESLDGYNQAGIGYGDWVGICEVAYSCIQSLHGLPIGWDDYVKFPGHRTYTDRQIAEILDHFARDYRRSTWPEFRNLGRDPHFVEAGNGDFQLRNYSPAVDAGIISTNSFFPRDLAGHPRVANKSEDLGAYELQGSALELSSQLKIESTCDGFGNIYKLSPTAGNAELTGFVWKVDRNNGSGFVTLPADSFHSGVSASMVTITHPILSMNGWSYQLVSGDFTSDPFTLRVSGPVVFVNAAATGANHGANWANAFTSFQAALDAAAPCSEVWVAAGTYLPTPIATQRDAAFHLRGNVSVYGGFAGTETMPSQRDPLSNRTILSGRISNGPDDVANSHNIFVNGDLERIADHRSYSKLSFPRQRSATVPRRGDLGLWFILDRRQLHLR